MFHHTFIVAVGCIFTVESIVFADAPNTAFKATVVEKLVLTPAVEPKPALKYQLLPKFIDRRPGNAAPRYAKAMLHYRPEAEVDAQIVDWLEMSPAEFAKPETRKAIDAAGAFGALGLIRDAALLQSCDWELPLREQNVFAMLLPEVQEMRRLGRYVALRARMQLVDRKFEEAIDTLAVGYAMARHVAESPTLINGLVGAAIASQMDRVVLELAQSPGAPSLFWAATFQPRPLVDLRPGFEGEMYSLYLAFPALRLKNGSDEEWRAASQNLLREFSQVVGLLSNDVAETSSWKTLMESVAVTAEVVARRDGLRAFLVECGRDPAEAAKLGDSQLLLEFSVAKYEDLRDDMFRWMALPYPEARRGIDAAESRLKQVAARTNDDREIIPFATLLLPAVRQVARLSARTERRVDVLRIVEALRLYAGRNDGRLPKSLAEIEGLPLPKLDAVTGEPFAYTLEGDTARLVLSENRGSGGQEETTVYEISVAK